MSDEKRTQRAMGQLSADDPGGPSASAKDETASSRSSTRPVPVGIERVLFVASQEPAFRAELVKDAEQAVRARGLSLRDSEWAMLRSVPVERLLAAAEGMDTSPSNVERRGFMRAVAAGAVAVAAAGCGSDGENPPTQAGVRADDATVDVPNYPDATGSRPDWPDAGPGDAESDTVDLGDAGPDYPAATGIRPDDGGA